MQLRRMFTACALSVLVICTSTACQRTGSTRIPRVTGEKLKSAEMTLQEAHLKYKIEIPSGSPARRSATTVRTVVSQLPTAGQRVKRGTTVTLVSPL